jgi:alanine-glyoxylate transaminase/serine-glyoxylate transaminase/serine-pyruvate transaminase
LGGWKRILRSWSLLSKLEPLGLEPFVDQSIRLPMLNAVKVPECIQEAEVRKRLLNEFQIEIGAGLGALAGKVWRIGLMGESSHKKNILYLVHALEKLLV